MSCTFLLIDEELHFLSIKERITSKFLDDSYDLETKFRFSWEIFLILRVISVLNKEYPSASQINEIHDHLNQAFDLQTKDVGLLESLFKQKKTVGFKIDNLHMGTATPNFYASIEPSTYSSSQDSSKTITISIDDYKDKINKFLNKNKAVIYILIDKLDEFVVKEEYDAQKKAIQGLLHCQRGYINYTNIKLRLFLRTDLFYKLDFQALGYDKVKAKTVELKWSPENMRQFIARRVLYNLANVINIRKIEVLLEEENLSAKPRRISQKYPILSKYVRKIPFFIGLYKALYRGIEHLNKSIRKMDARDARKINLNDALSRCLIKTIFPSMVDHKNNQKVKKREDIFIYLQTHFSLASGEPTPRIILMFLQKSLEYTRRYYKSNPDIHSIEIDKNNEYPLILRDCMYSAYEDLKFEVWETCSNISDKWKPLIEEVRSGREKFLKNPLSYSEIKRILKIICDDEKELREFLAFGAHIGLLETSNSRTDYTKRTYKLPILFR
ncbi:MAG: P-loop ATPase, Sll1717 family [Methylomicrobium sp.]